MPLFVHVNAVSDMLANVTPRYTMLSFPHFGLKIVFANVMHIEWNQMLLQYPNQLSVCGFPTGATEENISFTQRLLKDC